MTDKLKCPFCGAELNDYPDKTTGARMAVCRNPKCKYDGWHFPIDITQRMIDGKKAQDALKHLSQELCYLCMDEKSTKANLYKQINELLIYSHNAIGEITSITKGESNE